ncbi:MAG: DUF1549 domain-containing protein [Planctomycetes bacterium]|nr:DUF1549 domain-containing protein [Planctomycetota bacterium]
MRFIAVLVIAGAAAFQPPPQEPEPSSASGRELIDQEIQQKWKDLGLRSAGPADESEFLRRVYLDLAGTIPSLDQVEAYFKSHGPDRRARLVDEILGSKRFAENWAEIWSGLLVGHSDGNMGGLVRIGVQAALKSHFARNTPYDEFARAVITADGKLPNLRGKARGRMMGDDRDGALPEGVNGLVAFYVGAQRQAGRELPLNLAGRFSKLFLGTQIQCAQCHDHPFDKWTQEDFYGMAAFFTQVTVRREAKNDKEQAFVVGDAPGPRRRRGIPIPDSKKPPIPPTFLGTRENPRPGESFRSAFARFLTAKGNLQFARTAVNRTWAHFMGRGLVHPPDGFDEKNLPSHPRLLDALANDFIEHGYDLQWLLREIALSKTYQQTSKARKRTFEMEKYYAVAHVRALTPEQIVHSLVTAATVSGDATSVLRPRQLLAIFREFRYAFGDDEGAEVLEFQGTIPAALVMMNSPAIQKATMATARGGRLASILAKYGRPADRVRALFAAVYARTPTPAEAARYGPVAAKGAEGCEDIYWTLLNSSEFLFNH